MQEGDVPGLSVAIIRDGKMIWNHAFGVKNASTREPVDDNTVFEAASLSKPVMAYAALKLVDAGKLDLDKPLAQYLEKPYLDGDDRLSLITARRVLTHTTGFPNWRPQGQALKIVFPPGERFSYSGEGFVYLQKVIEQLTGQAFDDFMRATVFEPLGMTSSSYVWLPKYETLKATGHDAGGTAYQDENLLKQTRRPVCKQHLCRLRKIHDRGDERYRPETATAQAMTSSQIQVDESCSNCVNRPPSGKLSPVLAWGFGVGLQQTKDGSSFWHWGDNGDVHCYMLGYPKQREGIVVFTNSGNGHAIIPEIIREALGGEQPAIAWIRYEPYNSPARLFFKDILARGVSAVSEYREQQKNKRRASRWMRTR